MKYLDLAEQIIPLLITAGMQLAPLLKQISTTNAETPTPGQWNALHDLRAQALAKINDTHGDRR